MILDKMTPQQKQLAFFSMLLLFFITMMVIRSIATIQFFRAQANAYNALANAIEEGAPVTIPITVNTAKFPAANGNTDN